MEIVFIMRTNQGDKYLIQYDSSELEEHLQNQIVHKTINQRYQCEDAGRTTESKFELQNATTFVCMPIFLEHRLVL